MLIYETWAVTKNDEERRIFERKIFRKNFDPKYKKEALECYAIMKQINYSVSLMWSLLLRSKAKVGQACC
jgi:hypothetical protein